MRLLRTDGSLKIDVFQGTPTVEYAILSHTWGDEEVTLQDMQDLKTAQHKAGFSKIQSSCSLALSEGHDYIWIDTCCIDQSSSAELSEAINSMFRWYENAAVCYAYLSDVRALTEPENATERTAESRDMKSLGEVYFSKSRWFTRGWTLQELIAPKNVAFYSKRWGLLGTKIGMPRLLSKITGIDLSVLLGDSPELVSIARRMFWASQRQTTRLEDQAYCLLGLFSVNMPLLYGEGEKAFHRLQVEILKVTDDQSIFAWEGQPDTRPLQSLIAPEVNCFRRASEIDPVPSYRTSLNIPTSTSTGLNMGFLVAKEKDTVSALAILDCHTLGKYPGTYPAVQLTGWVVPNGDVHYIHRKPELCRVMFCDPRGIVRVSGHNWSDWVAEPQLDHNEVLIVDEARLDPYVVIGTRSLPLDFRLGSISSNPRRGRLNVYISDKTDHTPSETWRCVDGFPTRNWDSSTQTMFFDPLAGDATPGKFMHGALAFRNDTTQVAVLFGRHFYKEKGADEMDDDNDAVSQRKDLWCAIAPVPLGEDPEVAFRSYVLANDDDAFAKRPDLVPGLQIELHTLEVSEKMVLMLEFDLSLPVQKD